jgi:protein phosphatase
MLDLDAEQASAVPLLSVEAFGITDKGKVRPTNQDQFLVATLTGALRVEQSSFRAEAVRYAREEGHMFVVADGMGGHAGGETASALAVSTIERFLLDTWRWTASLDRDGGQVLREFQEAIRNADARLFQEGDLHPELRGMGTTVTMAFAAGSKLFVAHVGDSRAYLLRNGKLYRLTRDHTLVQTLLDQGTIAPTEAAKHELRNVVLNAVGGGTQGVHAELHKAALSNNDVLLLCTDGLTRMVPETKIAEVLRDARSPKAACKILVRAANEGGGTDNITAVVACFTSRTPAGAA